MTTTNQVTPTSTWLAATAEVMAPLPGAAGTAERLLLLLHYGVDWSSWVGRHRATYWDGLLPNRVLAATYRTTNLRAWWAEVSAALESGPRSAAERSELAALMTCDPIPVLEALRTETAALVLRVRIVAEHVRAGRQESIA